MEEGQVSVYSRLPYMHFINPLCREGDVPQSDEPEAVVMSFRLSDAGEA